MSMLPAPERNASARAAPHFRQNHVVAAKTQTVPNRSSKSHPQVNSPSEYPMALVVPPEATHQSEVAPYVSYDDLMTVEAHTFKGKDGATRGTSSR